MADPIQIKTAEQVRDDILAAVSAETGINDAVLGATIRQLAYAVGSELDEFYYQLWRAMNATYIKKATGSALDDRGADFGLTRRAARVAVGTAQFSCGASATVPLGTLISAPATTTRDKIQFRTLAEVSRVGAGTVDAAIEAVETGEAGNLANATITQLDTSISNITAVTNPAATTLGRDTEDDDTYRERILAHIDGLSAATIPAIRDACLNFELQTLTLQGGITSGATSLAVAEDLNTIPLSILIPGKIIIDSEVIAYTGIDTSSSPHQITGLTRGAESTTAAAHNDGATVTEWVSTGRGTTIRSVGIVESLGLVKLYLDDGTVAGAHSSLVSLVDKRIKGDGTARDPGVRPAGVAISSFAATVVTVSVAAQIQVKYGHNPTEVKTAAATAVSALLNSFKTKESVDGYAVACAIMDTDGVETIVSGSLSINGFTFDGTDSSDVTISETQVARAGTVTIT